MRVAIILSGGIGSRMGLNIPKQYVEVNDKPIICYTLERFLKDEKTDVVIVGCADEWKSFVEEQVLLLGPTKRVYYSKPGETRQYSIFNALIVAEEVGAKDDDVIIIHDAVRPLVSIDLIHCCYEGCNEADGILPVIPVKDTIYYSEDGRTIGSLLDRKFLWAG